jgi:squalene synthase HpnC
MSTHDQAVRAAYAHCMELARSHYENFPVASLFVSRPRREALAAIYAFARAADDFADEPAPGFKTSEARLAALADWRRRLKACYDGEATDHPVFIALGDAIHKFRLTPELFDCLLRAFEMDVRNQLHADFASLLAYCQCSANPVGGLVLELYDERSPEIRELADALCTGLQLANFWQDTGLDLDRDRIYLPLKDLQKFGLTVDELKALRAGRDQEKMPRFERLMGMEVDRVADFFEQAKPLPEQVGPGLRFQLRLTWQGGMAILRKIKQLRFQVLTARPALQKWDALRIGLKSLRPAPGHLRAIQPRGTI